jgi:ribonuclease HI
MKQSFVNFMFREKKIIPTQEAINIPKIEENKKDEFDIEELILEDVKVKEEDNDVYELYFDGCSKGNPGFAGAGAVIYKNKKEIFAKTSFVGKKETNNTAEYTGLIIGLNEAAKRNIKNITVKGDSQLVIKQMKGQYRVKADNMKHLYETAKNLEKLFDNIHYTHVYREYNKRADELSNIALMQTMV